MLQAVPEKYHDLLLEDKKSFANLSTIMPDQSPQVTPVWFDVDQDYVWINSAKGRVKDQNMRERPDVALAILDPDDPYRYIQIRGEVVEITTEGAREHINKLSKKYLGKDKYPGPPGETRVIYKIRPTSIHGNR